MGCSPILVCVGCIFAGGSHLRTDIVSLTGGCLSAVLPDYQEQADEKQEKGQAPKGQGNACRCIHKKAFRNNVNEHILSRIQDPKIIIEKEMVEKDKVPGKIRGYNKSQKGDQEEKQACPNAQAGWKHPF